MKHWITSIAAGLVLVGVPQIGFKTVRVPLSEVLGKL
jgi:hypothetical protein